MKKRLQGLIAGILIGAMLTSGVVFAKQISETAELFYNNIKIYIDGGEIVPKDANGNVVEPFTMDGTTYLPVRAISNALGKDVEWDGATQSVYIGKKDQTKPDNYLDRIQYNDFVKANQHNSLYRLNGTITDYLNNTYTNGMLFQTHTTTVVDTPRYIDGDKDEAQIKIDYPLNSLYKKLLGKIVLPKSIDSAGVDISNEYNQGNHEVCIMFYGDGKLIKKIRAVTPTMPFDFNIDITGVNLLTIKVKDEYIDSWVNTHTALTDLALYK